MIVRPITGLQVLTSATDRNALSYNYKMSYCHYTWSEKLRLASFARELIRDMHVPLVPLMPG